MQQPISIQFSPQVPIASLVFKVYCVIFGLLQTSLIVYCGVVGLMQICYRQMIGFFKRTTTTFNKKHYHRINRWHCVCENNSRLFQLNNMRHNMQVIMMGKFTWTR